MMLVIGEFFEIVDVAFFSLKILTGVSPKVMGYPLFKETNLLILTNLAGFTGRFLYLTS